MKTFQILEWTVDPDKGTLCAGDQTVRIEPKIMSVLVYLAEHSGQIIKKEEIIQSIWEEKFISDEVLTVAIHELRRALGDDAKSPRFIKTVPKIGYKFIPAVTVAEPSVTTGQLPATERTPKQIVRDGRPLSRYLIVGLVVLMAIAIGSVVKSGWLNKKTPAVQAEVIRSLAVLPLENLSNDPEQGFFADGMTDALITDLAKLEQVRVISRTSVMEYKNAKKSLPQIARELNVDAIVEGSVLRSGNQVRITVQLIDAADDKHLWAEKYDRPIQDIIALQNDVVSDISVQISRRIGPAGAAAGRAKQVSPDVYESYLKGRFFWNKRTPDDHKMAVRYFEEAIAKDPNYAPAYAGLSDCYTFGMGADTGLTPEQVLAKAKAASSKALELDENLADAHVSLAAIKFQERDWAGSEKEFTRAIKLNPNSALAHQWYGELLSATGRHADAIAAMRRARDIDPLAPMVNADLAWIYYMAHQYDPALEQIRKTFDLDPNIDWLYHVRGSIYRLKGMDKDSTENLKHFYVRTHLISEEEAKDIPDIQALCQFVIQHKKRLRDQYEVLADVYASLGDNEQSMQYLQKAVDSNHVFLFIKVNPTFDPLRSDARFTAILHSYGLQS